MNNKLAVIVIGLVLLLANVAPATARQNNTIDGLLLGGAGGAIIGQVVAGKPAGVIVGSIIGGTLGMLIDLGPVRERVVVINQPWPQPRVTYIYRQPRDHRDLRRGQRRPGRQVSDSWRRRR